MIFRSRNRKRRTANSGIGVENKNDAGVFGPLIRPSIKEKKVIYEPVKLEQNYRNYDFESPWEGTEYLKNLKKVEKDGKKN